MDSKEKKEGFDALKIAIVSVLTAVVVVFTMVVKIPTARGYLNLCDVAIMFIAFLFSPAVAFITAGLGTALADIISGYPQWAPISFVCHGLEGLLVAMVLAGGESNLVRKVIAWLVCVVCVAGGYFLLSGLFIAGFAVAAAEIPGNIGQASVGFVLGFVVATAVKKAYPPVEELAR